MTKKIRFAREINFIISNLLYKLLGMANQGLIMRAPSVKNCRQYITHKNFNKKKLSKRYLRELGKNDK